MIFGTLTRYNKRTVTVIADGGERWNVAPSLLHRVVEAGSAKEGDARAVTPDVRPALACYRVTVSAFRMPPLPTVAIDLAKGSIIYPLKRITKVTVELQSVDFGAKREAPSFLDARSH